MGFNQNREKLSSVDAVPRVKIIMKSFGRIASVYITYLQQLHADFTSER